MSVLFTPTSSDDISVFTTYESAKNFAGTYNLAAYFDKDNDADSGKISAAKLKAGQDTDADISNAWRARLGNVRTTYVTLESLLSSYTDEARWIGGVADMGIVIRAYEGRGVQDSNDQGTITDRGLDGRMAGLRKQYNAALQMIASGTSPLIQTEASAGCTRGTNAPVLPRVARFNQPLYPYCGPYGWRW